jgi:putative ABC transport system permease protein
LRWRRNLGLSLRSLVRARLRTALSAAGVAVGVGSVVVLIGAGIGAERALLTAMEPLGRNLLVVSSAPIQATPLRGAAAPGTTLTVADWRAIDDGIPGLERTAPLVERELQARVGGRALRVRVHGTTRECAAARNIPLVAGRFIDDGDVSDGARVAVVGAQVVEELFDGELPLGEPLLIAGVPFRIVGVAEEKGVSVDGANEDELVLVPLSAALRRLFAAESLDRIYVQAASEQHAAAARGEIATLLRRRHALDGRPDDFRILDQTALLRARLETGGLFSRFVRGISAVLLGLGGVGLLAVTLLSVRERYGEIGLRMAVGGRPRDILLQFLAEAVLISALGGVLGVAVGAAGVALGSALASWPLALGWQAVVYPLAVSVAIAVIFGTYPALRAARLDPIQALHGK